jgi:hypothetical protein
MKDGHLNKCKECAKLDVRTYRENSERPREYDRKRYRESEERRRRTAEVVKRWAQNNPEKIKAQYTLTNAVRDKRIKKQPCAICGNEKVEAHHYDYKKPLDVIWLCVKHHREYHLKK